MENQEKSSNKDDKNLENKRRYDQRFKRIQPRYNDKEYEKISNRAEKMGLTPTTYVKAVSLNYKHILNKPSKLTLETKAEIRRVGGNINQIAKALNIASDSIHPHEIHQALGEATKTLKALLTKLS